jgi:hypothetical protein
MNYLEAFASLSGRHNLLFTHRNQISFFSVNAKNYLIIDTGLI